MLLLLLQVFLFSAILLLLTVNALLSSQVFSSNLSP